MDKIQTLTDYYTKNRRSLSRKVSCRIFDGQEVEDVLQEAYSRALRYLDGFTEGRPVSVWFNRILNNVVADFRAQFLQNRAGSSHNCNEEFDEENFPVESENLGIDHVQIQLVKEHIRQKPEPLREVLTLYFLQEISPSEIVGLMEGEYQNVATVREYIHRFKKEMREAYAS